MCEKTNIDMGVNSNYKILGLFNKMDALETIALREPVISEEVISIDSIFLSDFKASVTEFLPNI